VKKMNNKYDLTRGPILNRLLLVAIPIMGSQLMQMTYNLTDMFWLGKMGSDAVASSGSAGMYMWLSMSFMLFGRMGAEIGVSQNLGAGDPVSAKKFAQTAVFISAALGIAYAVISAVFSRQLIGFFNIREADVAHDASVYLAIVSAGFPFAFMASVFGGIFTGAGNSKVPFIITVFGLITNMILDPLFIFTFEMGVAGAAAATVIGQFVVFVLSAISVKFSGERPFEKFEFIAKPDTARLKQIYRWSAPISVENFLFALLTMTISRFVSAFGADALSVSRVGSQIESLTWLIGGGFASAVTSFIGQNYGAKKWERIWKCFKLSNAAMAVWGVCVSFILFFLGRLIFNVFLQEQEILDMGQTYLKILAFCQVFMCLEGAAASIFRGIGETAPPSIVSIAGNVFRVPLSYFLARTALGLDGIWIGVTLGAALRGACIMVWLVLRKRKLPQTDINGQIFSELG
jgi:putative MATE family efflux protein